MHEHFNLSRSRVIKLFLATGLSQFILLATSPIITRLYNPDDYGIYSLFVSSTSVISIILAGTYEQAILLPKTQKSSIALALGSILVAATTSLLLLVLLFLAYSLNIFGLSKSPWILLLPFSSLLLLLVQIFLQLSLRIDLIQAITISRTVQSFFLALSQIIFGFFSFIWQPLVLSYFLALVASISVYFKIIPSLLFRGVRVTTILKSFTLMKFLIHFPKYMLIGQLSNVISTAAPVFILAYSYGSTSAGLYTIAARLLGLISALITSSYGDVFRSESLNQLRLNKNCISLFQSYLFSIISITLFPLLLIAAFAPFLFGIVFGSEWHDSGQIARILVPLTATQSCATPMASLFLIARLQKLDMCWQVLRLFMSLLCLMLPSILNYDASFALKCYVTSMSFLYLFHLFIQWRISLGKFPLYV